MWAGEERDGREERLSGVARQACGGKEQRRRRAGAREKKEKKLIF